jgi:hypothetical protein
MADPKPSVQVLYFDGCPSWQRAVDNLRALGVEPELRRVEDPDDAKRLGFTGSPTILINGRDPFATGSEPIGMSCRVYATPTGFAGSPTEAQFREVLSGR